MIKQNLREEYKIFREDLKKQLEQFDIQNQFSEIVFLCIGTNKIIGDMIGPMVGERLKKQAKQLKKYFRKETIIYGNMEHTLNLKNAGQVIPFLKYQYDKPFIITIDTALGNESTIEKILISSGEIEIGKALKKGIKYKSHVNIKGVVGKYHHKIEENINTLKNIKPDVIETMSKTICMGIKDTVKNLS